jgi:hypothetical protein
MHALSGNQPEKQADKMSSGGAKLISSSDASVGFGVPADWSGGKPDAPDRIIAEHNQQALESWKTFKNVSESFYKLIGSDQLIYNRGVRILKQAKQIIEGYDQKINYAARYLLFCDELIKFIDNTDVKAEACEQRWHEKFGSGGSSEAVNNEYFEFADSVSSSVNELLEKRGLTFSEVFPLVASIINTLYSTKFFTQNDMLHGCWYNFKIEIMDLREKAADYLEGKTQDIEDLEEIGKASRNNNGVLNQLMDDIKYNSRSDRTLTLTPASVTQNTDAEPEETAVDNNTVSEGIEVKTFKSDEENAARKLNNGSKNMSEVPDRVPNYHIAIDASPRVCGNCRFFKGQKSVNGHCEAFDFTAQSNYVCDAWQAISVTSYHTPVRTDSSYRAESGYNYADLSEGRVEGQRLETLNPVEGIDAQIHVDYSRRTEPEPNAVYRETTPGDALVEKGTPGNTRLLPERAAEKQFLPGEVVYSKSLRTYAVIQSAMKIGDILYYSLKLVRPDGAAWGSGISPASEDLQLRSNKAFKAVRSLDEVSDYIEVTRTVYKAVRAVVEAHRDITANPLSNRDELTPLREQIMSILSQPMFEGVHTGPKRKYYRAIQTALSAIGGARQILFESYRTISDLNNSERAKNNNDQIKTVMQKAQKDALSRLKFALKQVEDALVLPSATHGDPAPGIE